MAEIGCRHFGGYKPCGFARVCDRAFCGAYRAAGPRLLFVHLGALGAVLRSTALIPALRRLHPDAVITWVTNAPAPALIKGIADRILTTGADDLLKLGALEFDHAYVVDKCLAAVGVARGARVLGQTFGFTTDARNGAIVPATPAARELWQLGLNNHDKFFVNQKSEQRLTHEALELGDYRRDEYQIELTGEELAVAAGRRAAWGPGPIVGLNTGCSPALPAKKLSVEGHRELIGRLTADARFAGARIVLLGGPEDLARNAEIARDLPVVVSPGDRGLRDGMVSVAACDVIFSGDSLGMHMAIGLKKWVVAWFGPSCAGEIDLYDRGVKILSKAPCAPCWRRVCGEKLMCYDQVDFHDAVDALARGLTWLTSSTRPHFPETSSSPSL